MTRGDMLARSHRGVAARRRWLLTLLAISLAVTACENPPPPPGPEACDDSADGSPDERPTFAVAQGDGGSCEPPPPCEGCGEGNGDPHVRTFDGRRFDFHTAAEVVAARAPDSTFEVQWRQQQLGETNTAGIGAVAMRIDGSRVTVVGAGSEIRIDGDVVELDDSAPLRLRTGVTVHRDGNTVMVVAADRDGAVHVARHRAAMGVLVDPPDEHRGAMQGLLGDADGDLDNDVVLADGTIVADPSWEDVHPALGEAWRVTEATTLFDYDDGEGPDTYWDPTFPQRQPSIDDFTAEEQAAAEAVCRAAGVTAPDLVQDCIFDVLVTGDPEFATLAAAQQLARGLALEPGEVQGDAPTAAPGDPALRWDTALDGYRFNSRVEELVVDSAGHVLVQVIREDDGRRDLVALDLADGSVAWTAPDIAATCNVVADPDGLIFAQLVPRSSTAGEGNFNADLVAIDPATGELVDGMRYTSPQTEDDPRLSECLGALRLGPDGQVVLLESGLSLWSFATADGTIEPEWRRDYPVTQHRTTPLISADGSAVYVGIVAGPDPNILAMERVDLATGEATGSSPELGVAFATDPVADDGGVVLGVRQSGSFGGGAVALTRLEDDGETLAEDWQLVFDATAPFTVGEETFDENFGFTTFEITADLVVGYARGRMLAVDRSSGQPVWVQEVRGTNNHDRLAIDPAGNLYVSSFGGYWLRSLDADGVNWEIESGAPLVAAKLREAYRIGPVTDDDVLLVASTDEDGVIHVVALDLPETGG